MVLAQPPTDKPDYAPALDWWTATRRELARFEACVRAQVSLDLHAATALALVIAAEEPQTLTAIARRCGIQPQTITEMADTLTARGLALRERKPRDRRAYYLAPTRAGLELAEQVRRAVANLGAPR
ncbi:MAG: MarR family transcriptional regulator [Dehalococcoidia bacterium]